MLAHRLVKFALEHHLTLSVKGGGFNTAGWAVAGDIILDLSEMSDVRIDTPGPTGKAVVASLCDTPVRPPPETDSGARGTKRAEGEQFEQGGSAPRRRAPGAESDRPRREASGSTPTDESSSPALRKTRSGSRGSSSSDSRSPSGGEHSEQTEETSGPSRDSASAQGSTHTAGKGRGKGKEDRKSVV